MAASHLPKVPFKAQRMTYLLFLALMMKSTYTWDVKSFLTQECNQVLDGLESREEAAAAKPANVEVQLNFSTDSL